MRIILQSKFHIVYKRREERYQVYIYAIKLSRISSATYEIGDPVYITYDTKTKRKKNQADLGQWRLRSSTFFSECLPRL